MLSLDSVILLSKCLVYKDCIKSHLSSALWQNMVSFNSNFLFIADVLQQFHDFET